MVDVVIFLTAGTAGIAIHKHVDRRYSFKGKGRFVTNNCGTRRFR